MQMFTKLLLYIFLFISSSIELEAQTQHPLTASMELRCNSVAGGTQSAPDIDLHTNVGGPIFSVTNMPQRSSYAPPNIPCTFDGKPLVGTQQQLALQMQNIDRAMQRLGRTTYDPSTQATLLSGLKSYMTGYHLLNPNVSEGGLRDCADLYLQNLAQQSKIPHNVLRNIGENHLAPLITELSQPAPITQQTQRTSNATSTQQVAQDVPQQTHDVVVVVPPATTFVDPSVTLETPGQIHENVTIQQATVHYPIAADTSFKQTPIRLSFRRTLPKQPQQRILTRKSVPVPKRATNFSVTTGGAQIDTAGGSSATDVLDSGVTDKSETDSVQKVAQAQQKTFTHCVKEVLVEQGVRAISQFVTNLVCGSEANQGPTHTDPLHQTHSLFANQVRSPFGQCRAPIPGLSATPWIVEPTEASAHLIQEDTHTKRSREEQPHQSQQRAAQSRRQETEASASAPSEAEQAQLQAESRQEALQITQQHPEIILEYGARLSPSAFENNPHASLFSNCTGNPYQRQLHSELCSIITTTDRKMCTNPHHPAITSLGLTIYDISALANLSPDPEVATALTDSCSSMLSAMHGAEKLYTVFKKGIIQGITNNFEHKCNVMTGLVTAPLETLHREYVEPLMLAGQLLGKATSKMLDLAYAWNTPEEFESKARPLITMARNLARGVCQNPEEVIAVSVDLLIGSNASIVKKIKRLACLKGTSKFANAVREPQQIAQKLAAESKLTQEVAKAVEPTKTLYEEAIKTTYAEQKAAARARRAAERAGHAGEDVSATLQSKIWNKLEPETLKKIGQRSEQYDIRAIRGTKDDALSFFKAQVDSFRQEANGMLVGKDKNGVMFTYRETSRTGPPTIDVNGIPGIRKIKFLEK